jgi:hypothetical protein
MFKSLMSDFAFNRTLEKYRKIGKTRPAMVVASFLATQASETYPEKRQQKIDTLLLEMVNKTRTDVITTKQPGSDGCLDFDTICLSCASSYAVIEKDVEEDFYNTQTPNNQVKILVNLKLLPERFLSINFDDEAVVA